MAGIVQGVGFRPYIFRLANRWQLGGFVHNHPDGVLIEIEGNGNGLQNFVKALKYQPPPLALISGIDIREIPNKNQSQFRIEKSNNTLHRNTLISPDINLCEECRSELLDPNDRRYLYPFINCTNCGPRYTIISDIPYDRSKTSMSGFKMCAQCQKEYDDPLNRRFHAQPNACPDCGPSLIFCDINNSYHTTDAIRHVQDALRAGQIIAIKGIGGFHLAADAKNNHAVHRLRIRKHRFEKPLALMVKDLDAAAKYAVISEAASLQLTNLHRPIVLCPKKEKNDLCPEISLDNEYFGLMLPYSPLHELLFHSANPDALVMTSANISEEPICIANDECMKQMEDIADGFLIHNRDIYMRCDDSVLQIVEEKSFFIRRARGYSPRPIKLKKNGRSVLAVGGQLKNTICLTKKNLVFLSQHIGDLENLQSLNAFELTIDHLQRLFEVKPECIIHDHHPEYLSTKWAREKREIPTKSVQHHYAHILSVMAEHDIEDEVIGIALDGTGYGDDGAIWGGEVLMCNLHSFKRISHFDYLPLPGGSRAILEPWRMAVSYLINYFDDGYERATSLFPGRGDQIKIIAQAIEKNVNSPLTSSCGRLFDAVAALLGISETVTYEGQAAILLESLAEKTAREIPSLGEFVVIEKDGHYHLNPVEILKNILTLRNQGKDIAGISRAFHETLVTVFTRIASLIRSETGLERIALSGGCFQNRILLQGLMKNLQNEGFQIMTNLEVPVNDGGIALGQAYWGMHY